MITKDFDLTDFAEKFSTMIDGSQDEMLKITSITNNRYKNLDNFIRTSNMNYDMCGYDVSGQFSLIKVLYKDDTPDRGARLVYDFHNDDVYMIFDIPKGYNLAGNSSEFEASLFYNSLTMLSKLYNFDVFFSKNNLEAALLLCAIKYGCQYTTHDIFDAKKMMANFPDEISSIVDEIITEQSKHDIHISSHDFSTIMNIMQYY